MRANGPVALRVAEPVVSASGALSRIACLAVLESFTLAKQDDGDMLAHLKVLCFLDALPAGLLPGSVLLQVDWARDARNFDL